MNSSIVAAAIFGAVTLLVSSITIARQSKDREKERETLKDEEVVLKVGVIFSSLFL